MDMEQARLETQWEHFVRNAEKAGTKVELTFREWNYLRPQPCHFCGGLEYVQLDLVNHDRIVFSQKNLLSACMTCITMRDKMTNEVFLRHVHKIAAWTK